MDPHEVETVGPAQHDLARRKRIDLLLDDDAWKQRHHDDCGRDIADRPPRLGHDVGHAIVGQRHVGLEGADALGDFGAVLQFRFVVLSRHHRRVTAMRVDHHLRLLVGAPQPERDEPGMQQARVIRVLDVCLHQLPVGRNVLAGIAEQSQRAARIACPEHAFEIRQDGRPEEILERLDHPIPTAPPASGLALSGGRHAVRNPASLPARGKGLPRTRSGVGMGVGTPSN